MFIYEISNATPSRKNGVVVGWRNVKTYNYAVISTTDDDEVITHALTVSKRTAESVKSAKKREILKLLNAYALTRGTLNDGFTRRTPAQRNAARRFELGLEKQVETLEIVNVCAFELDGVKKC